ncbi:hypothetical protein EDD21DRAFT_217450 [Dissophora ornata]|nr:hypothetical protein BGZ58_002447 [Dissophora ornata]KAI8597403.1 hypothetical protein EDD21DRAFT_217450 [Dissophora ornata]
MVMTYPPTSNHADTSAQSAVLDAPDSTFSLLYFDTIGAAGSIRSLLALGGASWNQLYPQDWENEDRLDKISTPFEVMPVLYIHSSDGSQTVPIAESKPIELYLAEKYGCLGRNSYERHLISSFTSSTASLWDDFLHSAVNLKAAPEVKQEQIGVFLKDKVPNWICIHEQHLKANGLNGHYVGDTISLADLRTASMIDLILRFPPAAQLFTPETTPGLVKVKEVVDSNPKIKQWRESELYKSLRPSRAFPAFPRPSCVKLNDRQGNKAGGLDA